MVRPRRHRIALALVGLCGPAFACVSDLPAPAPVDGSSGTAGASSDGETMGSGGGDAGTGGDTDGSGPDPDLPPPPDPGDPGGEACSELICLPCGNGLGCAEVDAGEYVDDSCCAEGDTLVWRGRGSGAEVVDLETDGVLTVTCGGFGAAIDDISDPANPETIGGASSRCQRAAFGPVLPTGEKVLYLAHHGDTWVPNPFLATYLIPPDGGDVVEIDAQYDGTVLHEGLVYDDGLIYNAAHGGGLRVYRVDERGIPSFVRAIDGFENAIKPLLLDGYLYVADGAGGVKVLSLADRENPSLVATIPTFGLARDLDGADGRLYVAKGGEGVDVFDVSDPSAPFEVGHLTARGSVQAVDVDGDILAIAAWSHVAVHDATTLQLLGTERVRHTPQFEQDLGIVARDGIVQVGEWEGLHVLEYVPGLIAPDIWVEQEIFEFSAEEEDSAVVVVRNRGYLDLWVPQIEAQTDGEGSVFWADAETLSVPPGESRAFEVGFTPPATDRGTGILSLTTNDPDETQSPMVVPLRASVSNRLDIGDRIDERFAFLDPTGQDRVENLEGHVVVLAYFALF